MDQQKHTKMLRSTDFCLEKRRGKIMGTSKVFAFIINGEVFHTMTIEENSNTEGLIAGMFSEPKIVDASGVEGLKDYPFWKYDEETKAFSKEEGWLPLEQDLEDDYEVE
jgi:hypothetical protein